MGTKSKEGIGAQDTPHIVSQTELGTMEICPLPVFYRKQKTENGFIPFLPNFGRRLI